MNFIKSDYVESIKPVFNDFRKDLAHILRKYYIF